MFASEFAPGTVGALLETDLVTPPTRAAMEGRRNEAADEYLPQFFTAHEFATLRAACLRLMPEDNPVPDVVPVCIDKRLAAGDGNGWRYDVLPSDHQTFRAAMAGFDQTAQIRHQTDFAGLPPPQQDDILDAVRNGTVEGEWQRLDPLRFFEELLSEAAEWYYSNPTVQEQIGYIGFADGRGWKNIGLNQREDWEPLPVVPGKVKPHIAALPPVEPLLAVPEVPAMCHYSTDEIVDAVVIGTGAGGAPLLARLAQAGLSVVALEAGKHHDPTKFATDERHQEFLFWKDERLSAGENPVAFGNNNSGIGVGGSTLHYTAYTPRPHPDDFQIYSDFGVGANWPLTYHDLAPYFDEVEQFLGVSGPTPYPWGAAREKGYPLAPLPLNGAAQLMQRGCDRLGIRTSPAPNAALSARYFVPGVGWRNACTNRGFCQAGCSVGAKASMDVTFVPVAVGAGAEIRSESFVTTIERDGAGRISGVIYTRNGIEYRQRCRNLFLCAGAIETPRLLLLNNLANSSGQVGRNFMAHTGMQVWGQFDESVYPHKGIPGGLISEETHRPKGVDFAGGYLLQSIGVMPVTYAAQYARGEKSFGNALGEHLRGYNHTAGINILGECLPYPQNFLELADEKDGRGLPKPRIHFTAGENEKRITAHAETTMREIWGAAGGQNIWSFDRYAHTLGTCRMGADAQSSVVDREGRAHDVPGLYLCDNSVFPSALAVNPALTIMALSLHIADCFLERARQE